uniref:Uncharacterized protein n=1 Tax=Triticum urartu TaxID=4572 RepID=A0A8R7R9A3_TRIUA
IVERRAKSRLMSRCSIHLFFFRASELWQLEEGKEHTFLTQIER